MFGVRILEEKGYPEEMIHAIKATYLGMPRETITFQAPDASRQRDLDRGFGPYPR